MPPRLPRPPRSPRQRRPRSRTCSVPSCPASPRMVSRSRRAAAFGMLVYAARQSSGASRSAPAAPQSDIADPCPNAGASPRRTPECASIPEAAPGRRWPCLAAAPFTQDSRLPSGLPVCRRSRRPCRARAARKWLYPTMWHQSGTTAACLAFRTAAALQRRFARCHYLLSRHSDSVQHHGRDFVLQSTEVVTARSPLQTSRLATLIRSHGDDLSRARRSCGGDVRPLSNALRSGFLGHRSRNPP